jgi:hypothetical protein
VGKAVLRTSAIRVGVRMAAMGCDPVLLEGELVEDASGSGEQIEWGGLDIR